MDDINNAIAEAVRSGQYFKDARSWYAHRYLAPITERSLLLITTLISLILLIVVLVTIYQVLPVKKEVPFVIKVQDGLNHYSVIKPLNKYSDNPQKAIAEYLVADYVRTRESYVFKNVEKQIERMRSASSKQQFKKFEAFMRTQNPQSPLLVFQKHTTRTIDIVQVSLVEDGGIYDRALVRFRATLDNRLKKEKIVSSGEAVLTFTLPDINSVHKDHITLLDFSVTDYKATEIK